MDNDFPMTPSKPYIFRGVYQWIVDNDATPYMLVDASYEGVVVPPQHVDDNNQIILNISPTACQSLLVDDMSICFSARFSGQPMEVVVPMAAVHALYARENGQGMVFDQAGGGGGLPPDPPRPEAKKPNPRAHLRVVK